MKKPYLDELIALPDISRLIQELSETDYGPDLEEALIHGRDAASVDEALKNNMVRTYQKVSGFLNDEAQYILITLLARWDIFNIKTILRGKQMHLTAEQVSEGLLPAGYLTQVDLEALAMQDDIRAVVDTAMTWQLPFAGALSEGYAQYHETDELAAMELALDRYYATWAVERLRKRRANMKVARKVLGMQIDIMNLVMVFRLQKADTESIEVESFFLNGGLDIDIDLYKELGEMSDIDEVLDRLRNTSYGIALDEAAIKYLEENSIAVFERALEDYFMRKTLSQATGDPLGIGVAIAYLWAKQNEITNLRIIVKGKAVGMPEDRVRGELILV
jgi:V/A-type H+-transporting ATPase subunit C